MLALHHGGDPLQPHAGVNRGLRQVDTLVGELLELHEDEVPDLDETVAILVRRTGRAARNVIAMVVENLGTGAARPGIAHRPEIVRSGDTDDPVVGETGDLFPVARRLVILVVDGDEKLVLVQSEFPGHQVPGQLDRVFLEIVAEREIAEHLEKGVVTRGVADILKVVVLAAGADTFLRGHRAVVVAGLEAGEQVLELHHAGVGEHQCGIVLRNQRAGGHDFVAVGTEIFKKSGSDVVYAAHHSFLRSSMIRTCAQACCPATGSGGAAWQPGTATARSHVYAAQRSYVQPNMPVSDHSDEVAKKPRRQCRQGLITSGCANAVSRIPAGKFPRRKAGQHLSLVPAAQLSPGIIGSSGDSGTTASGDSAID